jgi:two-component system, LytTR family, response regulator LytT
MNLLVVEEEKTVVEEIRDILDKLDKSIQIIGVTENMSSVPAWLKKNSVPDLILVNEEVVADMQELCNRPAKAVVTFSTNTEAYNFEAFRFNTLKPILRNFSGEENWIKEPETKGIKASPSPNYRERFLVKQGQRLHSIHINEIAYFFSEGRFIFFKTLNDQKYITEYRIEKLEVMLSPARFFRINRSYIVSLNSVKQIHSWFGNRLKLYLDPEAETEILVSRERVRKFKTWLGK